MTEQDTNNTAKSEKARTIVNEFKSGSIFEKINAISSIGGIVIAFVALWITLQISGLEGYFQSKLTLKNQQLEVSSKELDAKQVQISDANFVIEESSQRISRQARELEKQSERLQLLQSRIDVKENELLENQIKFEKISQEREKVRRAVNIANAEIALRDFSHRLLNASFGVRKKYPIDISKAVFIHPGKELIEVLSEQYDAVPSKNKASKTLFESLEMRCSLKVDKKFELPAIAANYHSIRIEFQNEIFFTNKDIDEKEYEKKKAEVKKYSCEKEKRKTAIINARENARDQVYECAAEILNIEPLVFDQLFDPGSFFFFDAYYDGNEQFQLDRLEELQVREKYTRKEECL